MRQRHVPLFLLSLVLATGQGVLAQDTTPSDTIDRVEEDWEFVVGMPDLVSAGPQLTTTMSPEGDNSNSFVAFNLNYRDLPFRQGGMQLTSWTKTLNTGIKDGNRTLPLAIPGERISWTQSLKVADGQAELTISNGKSWSWWEFGKGESLSLSFATTASNLNSYHPDVSLKYSGAGWQSNRLKSMTLLRVRYYSGDNLVRTDQEPRTVVTSSDEDGE